VSWGNILFLPDGTIGASSPNEETARYMEYKNTGEGANASERVAWSKQLTKKEAEAVTVDAIFRTQSNWNPID